MPQVDLTTKFCEGAKPGPDGKQIEYRDTKQAGLSLLVSPKTKSWSVVYAVDGKRRRMSPGRFPEMSLKDARKAAEDVRSGARKGDDPQSEKQTRKAALTVAELAVVYLTEHAEPKKRTADMDRLAIRQDILPEIGTRKLIDLKRADIAAVNRRVMGRGKPTMANRTFEVIRSMLAFAVDQGLMEINPADGMKKPAPLVTRNRTLSDSELRDVWHAAGKGSRQSGAALKLLLLTGRRESEVIGMRWRDLHLDQAEWHIAADALANKSRKDDIVPLSPLAVEILRELETDRCPEDVTVMRGKRRGTLGGKPTRQIAMKGKLAIDKLWPDLEPWRIHDFRRVVRTNLSKLKVPPHIAELVLGHSIKGITAVYDRYTYLDERRDALEAWERHLRIIVGLSAENVVQLRSA